MPFVRQLAYVGDDRIRHESGLFRLDRSRPSAAA
jgi:hypothetical protein